MLEGYNVAHEYSEELEKKERESVKNTICMLNRNNSRKRGCKKILLDIVVSSHISTVDVHLVAVSLGLDCLG
jgi:acetamidase/formamidase